MIATIMDGKRLANEIKSRIKEEVESFKRASSVPCLATVLVGDDPASKTYLKIKHSTCCEVGIQSKNYELPSDVKQEDVQDLMCRLNDDKSIHGILIQLPIPPTIDGYKIVDSISPEKDVDGLHPYNTGRISYRRYELIPCTPKGIVTMLAHYRIELEGKHAVIINRSNLVGKPLYLLLSSADPLQMLLLNADMLLLNLNATVTICHSKTQHLSDYSRDADILITAVGRRPGFSITEDMVKRGAVVVDVGVTKMEGKTYGDVDFENVVKKASFITPVPGGVGPMTVAMLMHNTLIAAGKQTGHRVRYDLEELWHLNEK